MSTGLQADVVHAAEMVPLAEGEVQVWRIDAAPAGALAEACGAVLSDEEQERLQRMREGTPREEFRTGRGFLRMLLGAALQVAPRAVTVHVGPHGKPFVQGVEFNVAHSGGVVLIALCRSAAVGVDLERIDREVEFLEIAQANFAPQEVAEIAAARPGRERADVFYRCWTKKEALVKAHGRGLTLGLAEFAVSAADAAEAEVLLSESRLFVRELNLGGQFAGALAAGLGGLAVRQFVADAMTLGTSR